MKKVLIIVIVLILVFIISFGIGTIWINIEDKTSKSGTKDVVSNEDEAYNKYLEDIKFNKVDRYSIMGMLSEKTDKCLVLDKSITDSYVYKEYNSAYIKISDKTKYVDIITSEQKEFSDLSEAVIIFVNSMGEKDPYKYPVDYTIDASEDIIEFITFDELDKLKKQTFSEHWNEEYKLLSNLKIDYIYNITEAYNYNNKIMVVLLYIKIKNKELPYLINIRIDDDTIIENENSKDYKLADIVMEIHEATSKQVEWNQAKKIIYK